MKVLYWIAGFAMLGALAIAAPAAAQTPLPEIALTIDPVGFVNARTGLTTVTGTSTCAYGTPMTSTVMLRQNVGRFQLQGQDLNLVIGPCDGQPHAWSSTISAANGRFAGGKMVVEAVVSVFNLEYQLALADVTQTVMLRGSK